MKRSTLRTIAMTVALIALVSTGCAEQASAEVENSTQQAGEEVSIDATEISSEQATDYTENEETDDATAEVSLETAEVTETASSSGSKEDASEAISKANGASTNTKAEQPEVAGATKASGKNSSLMSMFPVINYDKKGTGRGPGANFRKGHDYENHEVAGGKVLGELNWWELTTWTASNGVVLKVLPADQGFPNGASIIDGCGLDNVPGSDFLLAVAECLGTGEHWGEGTDMSYQMTVVPVSQIPAASAKRTSIDVNDATLLGYKANYESIMNSAGGIDGDFLITSNSVAHRSIGGGDVWVISYDSGMGAWKVRINASSPYQYTWDGIKNILKYVNPDGEALYNAIYDDFYVASYDNPIEAYDSWWPCGNSQIYSTGDTPGYCEYFIK